jgi:hypothetical protein
MIVFRNTGLIDLTAVRTLGVSVKEAGAIGYFGTGVKFAVATILRGGGSVSLFRGKQEHRFGTLEKEVRGQPFSVVTLDGEELGFTTSLGRDWEPWMAFRELACNALDEGGRYYAERYDIGEIADDETLFVVDSEEMDDAYYGRGDIILESKPLYSNDYIEIRSGPASHVYYRGVRVGELARPTSQLYNVLRKVDLTEDRTIKYDWDVQDAIARGLITCDREDLVFPALSCGDKYIEHHLTFREGMGPSEEFLRVAAGLRGRLDSIVKANPSAMVMARMMSLSDLGPSESVVLHPVEQERFERAKEFLSSAGYDTSRYPITIVEDLGEGVYGLAKEDRIFIAKAAFQKGTKEVASTLLEEFVHLKTGFGDTTRQLQTWLFDELLLQSEKAAGVAL